jgi:phosphatidylglycerol:prolipoprotein diacylglycerol transferase
MPISFPGLNLNNLNVSNIAFNVGPFSIRWYGIFIALGLLLALFYAVKRTKDFKITFDDLTDVVLVSTIFAVIGARLYYCIFYIDSAGAHSYFANLEGLKSILYIWDGGLAFYGSIIGAFVSAFIYCKIRKLNPLPFLDIAGLGFLIGQAIGRCGNFFNREAYGSATTLPWRMVLDSSNVGYHPCFLYESLWCALGFVLLHFYSKHRKFNGELFLMYLGWNGLGRVFIEGLRTDSLYLIPNYLKVSQLLAGLLFLASVGLLIFVHLRLKNESAFEGYVPVYGDLINEDNEGKDEATDKDAVEDKDENKGEDKNEKINQNSDENKEDKTQHKSEE